MINDKIPLYFALFSHELKSPLNTIINSAKLIELNIRNSDETKIKRYLSLILSSSLYLKTFIQNTIEFGRISFDREELYIEEFDIIEVLYEIVDLTKIMIEEKNIEVEFNPSQKEFYITSDPIKIRQILLNISSNAAKFTKEGYIIFTIDEKKDGVLINVKDTGCGIKQEQLDKIFAPYCSLEKRYETICDSSGLGLFITKQLLSFIGGDISIKSELDKGTEVEIFIPSKRR
ncbi:Two-component sensor histidine kinase [Thermodesulfovibrio sp. N1]|uniref:sensor histidine kinase n=1 Tax=Thermodesulfovibrio sp. N1 TaxID=1871110 RepID=UPI000839DAAD|nr:HAMP domain-containing sensor histidine kinase [Thermodesulfovibrio sp. N1]ODA44371.1 Two-component sensor histidine kinase [Thermodesulfovibrio sp. N1]